MYQQATRSLQNPILATNLCRLPQLPQTAEPNSLSKVAILYNLTANIESLVPAQHQRTEELQMSQFFSVTYQPGEPIGFFFFQVLTRSDSEILNQQPKK